VYIGGNAQVWDRVWNGWIDEVAAINTTLTAAQVQQLYAGADVDIAQQPVGPVSFSVVASGKLPLSYQWKNGAIRSALLQWSWLRHRRPRRPSATSSVLP
jgi:hypothetical protein